MNPNRAEEIIHKIGSQRILVIGDVILDEFIWGRVNRISPEAPVPVVEVDSESYYPGGAANVARNLREFTEHVGIMGMVGEGLHAEQLKQLLGANRIKIDCLQQDPSYQTIVKTRIIARHQQVVRVDRERKIGLTPFHSTAALDQVHAMMPDLDAIIFEDYGKGLLRQDLVDSIISEAKALGRIVTVDPNPNNRIVWNNATAITPNRMEAFASAGLPWSDPVEPPIKDISLLQTGEILLRKWNCQHLLITLGEHGMMLFDRDSTPFHIPTRAREVFDVSGAGDTAIALFTLALCAGASAAEAAEISNCASGIVVGKLGTATLTPRELLASFDE